MAKKKQTRLGFSKPNPFLLSVGLASLLLVGPAGIAAGYYLEDIAEESAAWSETEGEILDSRVRSRRDHKTKRMRYKPIIRYAYTVAGQRYESDQIALGSFKGKEKSDELVRRFSGGAKTTVYYDPAAPGEAVLLRGMTGTNYVGQGGVIACIVGLVMVIGAFRQNDE